MGSIVAIGVAVQLPRIDARRRKRVTAQEIIYRTATTRDRMKALVDFTQAEIDGLVQKMIEIGKLDQMRKFPIQTYRLMETYLSEIDASPLDDPHVSRLILRARADYKNFIGIAEQIYGIALDDPHRRDKLREASREMVLILASYDAGMARLRKTLNIPPVAADTTTDGTGFD